MSFDVAFIDTVGLEGGFNDDPRDPGNWTGGKVGAGTCKGTRYGICAAQYPTLDIKNLTQPDAKEIYFKDYWLPLRLDEVDSWQIQSEIFDTGVNCGIGTATKIAQRALDFLGEQVVVDGLMGPQTISLLNKWVGKDQPALFKALNGFQFIHYVDVVEGRHDHTFARGWMKRIQDYRKGV